MEKSYPTLQLKDLADFCYAIFRPWLNHGIGLTAKQILRETALEILSSPYSNDFTQAYREFSGDLICFAAPQLAHKLSQQDLGSTTQEMLDLNYRNMPHCTQTSFWEFLFGNLSDWRMTKLEVYHLLDRRNHMVA